MVQAETPMILRDHLLIFSTFHFKPPTQTATKYENTFSKKVTENNLAIIETKRSLNVLMYDGVTSGCLATLYLLSAPTYSLD